MTNIIKFPGITNLDIDSAEMLTEIAKEKPEHVFVVTWNDEGDANYHSNTGDIAEVLLQLNQFIHKYYSGDFK